MIHIVSFLKNDAHIYTYFYTTLQWIKIQRRSIASAVNESCLEVNWKNVLSRYFFIFFLSFLISRCNLADMFEMLKMAARWVYFGLTVPGE
jgi:hypothetical protein